MQQFETTTDRVNFEGRVALVTGAGGGLGRSYARLLAARGAMLVINDLGGTVTGEGADASAAEAVVAEIVAAGGVAVADAHSVATPEGSNAMVQKALDTFGRIDILINNAGILRDRSMHKMEIKDFRAVLEVHLLGTFLTCRAAYPHMREQSYGRIVNTTSGAGLYGNFGQVAYSAAKAGVVGLSRTLAVEGRLRNVKVNVIAPAALSRMTGSLGAKVTERKPEQVAPAVAWLCHESCNLTGQIIEALGGRIAMHFIGETRGVWAPHWEIEDVAARMGEIQDMTGYVVPEDLSVVSQILDELSNSNAES